MALYSFEIGLTQATMVNLEALSTPVTPPAWTWAPYSSEIDLWDGSKKGMGSPVATWSWGFLKKAQRAMLKTFCAGRSAQVYIKTYKADRTTAVYRAVMVWPAEEEDTAERTLDFTLEFRRMVAIV